MSARDVTISVVANVTATATQATTLRAVLDGIRTGSWKRDVDAVRAAIAAGDASAAAAKKKLPAVMWSGLFARRSAAALTTHSGLICVDIDDLGRVTEATRDLLSEDNHTLAAFVSPSGNGLKVLLRCDPSRSHADSYHAAERFILELFGLHIDAACKDVSRLCFVSHDPDLFAADDAEVLPYPPAPTEYSPPISNQATGALTPGDAYDASGDLPSLLRKHGWKESGKSHWTRPGKQRGVSASLGVIPGRFWCFSTSTDFQANHTYRPWHVYAILECGGDFSRAASELRHQGFGDRRQEQLGGVGEPPGIGPASAGGAATLIVARALPDIHVDREARHESNLLGNGFLRRGGGMIYVGPTGVGKSTVIIQGGMCWSIGGDLFGIAAAKPLTVLYVQAENDDEDLEEISNGIIRGLSIPAADVDVIRRRFFVITTHERGSALFRAIEPSVEAIKPDILIIDPVLAFMMGEMNNQEHVTTFLRGQLHPFLRKHAMGAILIHHTPKPVRAPKNAAPAKSTDLAYAGAGSFEFANWARAVVTLQPVGRDVYDMVIGKRWKRAGLKGAGGFPIDTVRIAHASKPGAICWEFARPETVTEQAASALDEKKRSSLFVAFNRAKKDADGAVPLKAIAEKIGASERTVRRWFQSENDRLELNGEALRRTDDGRIKMVDEEEAAA